MKALAVSALDWLAKEFVERLELAEPLAVAVELVCEMLVSLLKSTRKAEVSCELTVAIAPNPVTVTLLVSLLVKPA